MTLSFLSFAFMFPFKHQQDNMSMPRPKVGPNFSELLSPYFCDAHAHTHSKHTEHF